MRAFASYEDLTRNFRDMFDAIDTTNRSLRHIRPPHRCHITTMTFTATLSHAVDIRGDFVRRLEDHARDDPYFTAVGPCAFSSCTAEFVARAMPSIRTKLFNKGALQLTGCKSHVEAMHTISEVCRVLTAFYGTPVEAETMACALINLNVTLDTGIRLSPCADAARARGYVAEQPERPPSCIIKFPSAVPSKSVTGLVYKTGKFVICGAPIPQDVSAAYDHILRLCDDAHETVLEPRRTDGIRRNRGQLTWSALVQCGMPGSMHTHPPTRRHRVEGCAYCERRGNYFCE